ncbi:DUF4437 domain-containing protein [Leisingera sp. ANG59]|uniref:DUF4437 domain-containing protein n=1 Tax=Leisingera sp. ANG59 TaxID=2675221 RepID=UPI0015728B70|nr:DUF4437 domain-containing protein [Leisingera sp. ANG59]NSY39326.1 DUF4437 domain-containing protein [Leisingera sp. ANG59]
MFNTLRTTLALTTTALSLSVTAAAAEGAPKVTLPDDVQWFAMIPEMGDEGPAMSVVFGELGEKGKPFAGLFRVPAGGLSPAHIHSSDYTAYMISGTESVRVKAEDEPELIPAGSVWFQPGNEVHINECMGPEDCVFYVYYPTGIDYIPTDADGHPQH